MKDYLKQFLVVSSFWLFPTRGNADSELDISVKGGPNAATLEHNNRDIRYGFSGGFASTLQRRFTERFSFGGQLELLYTSRGAETVVDGMTQGESREHYIDINLVIHPEVRFGFVHMYLVLGGGIDFLMSANKDNVLGTMEDITGDLHRIDVALLGGVGVALQLPRKDLGAFHLGSIFLEARHDIGLLDTDTINGGYKNRSSALLLGLSFAVGRPSDDDPSNGQASN